MTRKNHIYKRLRKRASRVRLCGWVLLLVLLLDEEGKDERWSGILSGS